MAKKKQDLSLEELLEEALVPKGEQPYEVLNNWVWTKINHLAFVTKLAGFEYTKYIAPNLVDRGIPLFKGKNVQSGELIYFFESFIPKTISDELPRSKLKRKCLLTPYVGTIGNVALFDGRTECHLGSNVGKIELLNDKSTIILEEFMLYFLRSPFGYDELTKHKKATAQESISIEAIRDVCIPLPPLTEQQRIVDRIESLFEKLDQAKELVQSAIDTFETRKAAILHKAFTGELTKKWREKNGVGMDGWEECVLSDICAINPNRVNTKGLSDDLAVTFVPMTAVSDILGIIESPQEKSLGEVKKGYTNFCENDVIFAKITPCMENGKVAIVGKLINDIGFGSTEFHVLRCTDRLNNRYLYHLVRSKYFRDDAKAVMTGAVGQQRVPKSFLESYPINLPLISEQEETVCILYDLFEKEQRAKELYDVVDQIDLMKKAILARAFRGELGTNDPTEESAIELLKKVLA